LAHAFVNKTLIFIWLYIQFCGIAENIFYRLQKFKIYHVWDDSTDPGACFMSAWEKDKFLYLMSIQKRDN